MEKINTDCKRQNLKKIDFAGLRSQLSVNKMHHFSAESFNFDQFQAFEALCATRHKEAK